MALGVPNFLPAEVAAMQAGMGANPFQAQMDQLAQLMARDQPQAGQAPTPGVNPFVNPAVAIGMALSGQAPQLLQGFAGVQAQEQARQDAFQQQQMQAENYRLLRAQRLGEAQAQFGVEGVKELGRRETERRNARMQERDFSLRKRATEANIKDAEADNRRFDAELDLKRRTLEYNERQAQAEAAQKANQTEVGQAYITMRYNLDNGVLYDPNTKESISLDQLPAGEREAALAKHITKMRGLADTAYFGLDAKLAHESAYLDSHLKAEREIAKELGPEPTGTLAESTERVSQEEVLGKTVAGQLPSVSPTMGGRMSAFQTVTDFQKFLDSDLVGTLAQQIEANTATSPEIASANVTVAREAFRQQLGTNGRRWLSTQEGAAQAKAVAERLGTQIDMSTREGQVAGKAQLIEELMALGVPRSNAEAIAKRHIREKALRRERFSTGLPSGRLR